MLGLTSSITGASPSFWDFAKAHEPWVESISQVRMSVDDVLSIRESKFPSRQST
jgi:hypothetical protein